MAQDYSKYKNLSNKNGKPVYNDCQKAEIHLGLHKGLDVDKYAVLNKAGQPVYNADQMVEIRIGLEKGLDVDKYAVLNKAGQPVYNWCQMEEIRKGLENDLDVNKYAVLNKDDKPVYNWCQMEKIRESLENDLDVDKFVHEQQQMEEAWKDFFNKPKDERISIEWNGKNYRIAEFEDMYLSQCKKDGVMPNNNIKEHFWKNCVDRQGYEPKFCKNPDISK